MASRGNKSSPSVPRGPPHPPSSAVIHMDYTLVETDDKDTVVGPVGKETRHRAPLPSAMAVAKLNMRPYSKTFIMRMTRSASLTSNGGGTFTLITLISPSQMDQYTGQLASLFRECRLVKTKIQYNALTGTDPTSPFVFDSALDPAANTGSSSPSSQWRLESVKRFTAHNPTAMRNSGPKMNRPFSLIDATGSGSDPVGGLEGGWIHNSVTTGPASTTVLTYLIECWYEFRFMK
jgi:hypothetical protein